MNSSALVSGLVVILVLSTLSASVAGELPAESPFDPRGFPADVIISFWNVNTGAKGTCLDAKLALDDQEFCARMMDPTGWVVKPLTSASPDTASSSYDTDRSSWSRTRTMTSCGDCSEGGPPREECGDGLDNDEDGYVDDGCGGGGESGDSGGSGGGGVPAHGTGTMGCSSGNGHHMDHCTYSETHTVIADRVFVHYGVETIGCLHSYINAEYDQLYRLVCVNNGRPVPDPCSHDTGTQRSFTTAGGSVTHDDGRCVASVGGYWGAGVDYHW